MVGLTIWIIFICLLVITAPKAVGRWVARVHKEYEKERAND